MAKKKSQEEGTIRISDSLQAPLESLVAAATKLRGRVKQKDELEQLIDLLEGMTAAAKYGCGQQTWHRKFTLEDGKPKAKSGK